MKYYVTIKVDSRYIAEVEAKSIEEAKLKAERKFMVCDLNEMEIIKSEPVMIENDNGDYVWEV